MNELFAVNTDAFLLALGEKCNHESTSLLDIFETYVSLAQDSSNACEPDMLRSLIFKQFQKYGDFDKSVQKTASAVSNIVSTTSEVMTAIQTDNKENLKTAYDKLKVYEEDICKLSYDMFKDDETGIYNRKFFFSLVLSEDMNYKQHGFLFNVAIENLEDVKDRYGAIVVKSILKKFSQMLQKALLASEQVFVKYDENEFLIFSDQKHANDVRNVLKLLYRSLEVKKFKITESKHLTFNFQHQEKNVKTDEAFSSPF